MKERKNEGSERRKRPQYNCLKGKKIQEQRDLKWHSRGWSFAYLFIAIFIFYPSNRNRTDVGLALRHVAVLFPQVQTHHNCAQRKDMQLLIESG